MRAAVAGGAVDEDGRGGVGARAGGGLRVRGAVAGRAGRGRTVCVGEVFVGGEGAVSVVGGV